MVLLSYKLPFIQKLFHSFTTPLQSSVELYQHEKLILPSKPIDSEKLSLHNVMRCVQIESDVNESYTAICFCKLPAHRHRLHFVPLFIEVKMYKVILHPSRRFISAHNGSFSLWLLWLPSHQIRCRAQVGGVIVACAITSLSSHNRYFSLAEV